MIPCHPGERGVRRAFSRMLHACMHLDKPSLPQEGFTLTGMANFKPFVMMCMPRNHTSLVSLRMQGSHQCGSTADPPPQVPFQEVGFRVRYILEHICRPRLNVSTGENATPGQQRGPRGILQESLYTHSFMYKPHTGPQRMGLDAT